MTTEKGDFEDPTYPNYNDDPNYVYSGQGSAHLTGAFYASISTSYSLNTLKFWIYSAADQPQEYRVNIYSVHFLCGGSSGLWGSECSSRHFGGNFTVAPHTWQEVTLDLTGNIGNRDISMDLIATGNGGTDYYLDDIRFENLAN